MNLISFLFRLSAWHGDKRVFPQIPVMGGYVPVIVPQLRTTRTHLMLGDPDFCFQTYLDQLVTYQNHVVGQTTVMCQIIMLKCKSIFEQPAEGGGSPSHNRPESSCAGALWCAKESCGSAIRARQPWWCGRYLSNRRGHHILTGAGFGSGGWCHCWHQKHAWHLNGHLLARYCASFIVSFLQRISSKVIIQSYWVLNMHPCTNPNSSQEEHSLSNTAHWFCHRSYYNMLHII